MTTPKLATLPDTFRTATAYMTAVLEVDDDQIEAPLAQALGAELAACPADELVMVFAAMVSTFVADIANAYDEQPEAAWRRHAAGYALVLSAEGGSDG